VACWHMANWFVWRAAYGKLAYGKLENGETSLYHFWFLKTKETLTHF